MATLTYVFAFIGAAWCGYRIVWPILWALLYATGYAIFLTRAARAGGRLSALEVCGGAIRAWLNGLKTAVIGWPADEVSIGQLRWTPLFGYSGFAKGGRR